jgi:UDP-N-acetylmuramate dehydrogenase
VDLASFNTYHLASRAAYLAVVETVEEAKQAWRFARENGLGVAVLGSGSNVIVSEHGFDGLVVVNRIARLLRLPAERVEVGAGTRLEDLIRFTEDEGLAGLERLAGIPGTVGGAVYGNAGAFGSQIGDLIEEVRYVNSDGSLCRVEGGQSGFSYRNSAFKQGRLKGIIVSAVLQMRQADPQSIRNDIRETLGSREGKHPAGASCGSFFKNLEADQLSPTTQEQLADWIVFGRLPAGRLIQEAGGKGLRVGGAHVSERHCNFLLNDGTASPSDLKTLAQVIKERVSQRFGVELEEEVRYL